MAKPESKSITLLRAIVAAGAAGIFASPKELTWLTTQGMVETNSQITDEQGNIAVRATQKGIDQIMTTETTQVSTPAVKSAGNFVIEDGFAIPAASKRIGKASTYPFEQMAVGQSFYVPATEDKPNPAKSLSTTVSAANRRFAEVIPGEFTTNKKGEQVPATRKTKNFLVRPTDDGGARVWRTE